MPTLYEQAIEAVYKAKYPKQATWKIPNAMTEELIKAQNPAGDYICSYHRRRYNLLGYPVEVTDSVSSLTLEVIDPRQQPKPGPSETKDATTNKT